MLTINTKTPPLHVVALALNSGASIEYTDSGPAAKKDTTESIPDILSSLAPKDATLPLEIIAQLSSAKDFATVCAVADSLEQRLTLRSYLYGYSISAADLALWGAIKSNTVMLGIVKRPDSVHLSRWYAHIEGSAQAQAAVQAVQNAAKQKTRTRAANATFELGLPDAVTGQVVTRFPPEPSGYLHIGHAKAAILNQYFARHYQGRFIVRFDDTNPSKESEEFQDSILEDLQLMGIHGDVITYTSDHFQTLYDKVIELLKLGKAYADDTVKEKMAHERMEGIASARRDATVEENLARFAEMTTGSEEGARWCLRAKISVDNLNKAMRDPVIYRVNAQNTHHRTGTKWKVYPTYDFACPLVDAIEGVSHALRTSEYRDRNAQYQWMLDALNMRKVNIWDYGRINFVYTLLSKRKLKTLVERGLVRGWDDPRFPTIRGMRRRGLTIEGLRQFMLSQGPSQALTSLEWDGIWTTNKKIIDPIVPRHHSVSSKNMVHVTINGCDKSEPWVEQKPKHKKNAELGLKSTTFGPVVYLEQEDAQSFGDNEEITLMDWGNAIVRSKEVDNAGIITKMTMDLHLQGDFRKTSKKVHWLAPGKESDKTTKLTNVALLDYDYLITAKKMEKDDSLDEVINPTTEFVELGVADANVAQLEQGDIIQFERKGYFIVDKPAGKPSVVFTEGSQDSVDRIELIAIPDGKAASVALKHTPSNENEKKSGSVTLGAPTMYVVKPVTADKIDNMGSTNMYVVKPVD